MAKRRKPKRRNKTKSAAARTDANQVSAGVVASETASTGQGSKNAGSTASTRNATLDSLRGFAIALMVVDHVAGILMHQRIVDSPVRWATRLSMPLFCVLMGYFLDPSRRWDNGRFRWRRLAQIVGGAVLVNLVFWPYYHKIEILGSLLIAYLLFVLTGPLFAGFVIAILFYRDDVLAMWLDFPPTIVVSFVAQGFILRDHGIRVALLSGLILSIGSVAIYVLEPLGVNHLLCMFVLPATLLVYAGQRWPNVSVVGFRQIGRYPLTTYILQYYVVFAIAWGLLK